MAALRTFAVTALVAAAGCGGGGAHAASPSQANAATGTAHVTLSLVVPRAPSGGARSPLYISAGTKSIAVTVNGGAAQGFNVMPGSPNCTAGASGTTCTMSLVGPIGFDTFAIAAYDQALTAGGAPQGNVLSDATLSWPIAEAQDNPLQISLGGAVASLSLNVTAQPLFWTQFVVPGAAVAKDAAGYTIVGYYDQKLTLALAPAELGNWEGGAGGMLASYDGFDSLTFEGGTSSAVTLTVTAANGVHASALLTPFVQSGTIAVVALTPGIVYLDVPYNRAMTQSIQALAKLEATLSKPRAAAFDSTGNVYVADTGTNAVAVFPPGSSPGTAPAATLASTAFGSAAPVGVATDPAGGTLYVATSSAVYAFTLPLAAGASPAAVISGAATGLAGITGLAAGTSELAVSMAGGSIATFLKGANGNVAPSRLIAGTATTLQSPQSLAFDPAGSLYVADSSANDVAVFAPNATGNVAPAAALSGAATALQAPTGVAVDHTGTLYVADHTFKLHIYAAGATTGNAAPSSTTSGGPNVTGLAVMP